MILRGYQPGGPNSLPVRDDQVAHPAPLPDSPPLPEMRQNFHIIWVSTLGGINDETKLNMTTDVQEQYLRKHKNHHRQVAFLRIFLLGIFLILWEISADAYWIDSFFFSSPRRVVLCLIQLWTERSLPMHIGITLLETILSFLLVFFVSLLLSTLFRFSLTAVGDLKHLIWYYSTAYRNLPWLPCSSSGWAPASTPLSSPGSLWQSSDPSSAFTPPFIR